MEKIDLSILKKIPELSTKAILEIEPLAPLSMVSELPGSYYKTLKVPDKKMLCGLLENLLGWHIDLADRKAIVKELSNLRKKQAKKDPNVEFKDKTKGSTYCPLLMDYFEVNKLQPKFSKIVFYDDLWSRAFRRTDSYRHTFGTRYIDTEFINNWNKIISRIDNDTERKSNDKETLKTRFFNRYMGKFPMYYSTPTRREYIQLEGKFQFELVIDHLLLEQLQNCVQNDNIGYLGSSEGWINISLK